MVYIRECVGSFTYLHIKYIIIENYYYYKVIYKQSLNYFNFYFIKNLLQNLHPYS